MKRYLLAAVAFAALITSPAAARDHSAYFGIEAGVMQVRDAHVVQHFVGQNFSEISFDIDHKLGVDGDLIAGYDFGIVRAEVEGAYKWARHDRFKNIFHDDELIFDSADADGHSRAYSVMGNVLVDLGSNEGVNFYAGGGAGIAWVKQRFDDGSGAGAFSIADNNFAWQAIAGVRAPVFRHFDVGLKYRYFDAGRIRDAEQGADSIRSRFRSHSILASLIYNFGEVAPPPPPPPAPPPPPPPPPPPATQTCPDGSVILATDACPAPPPPPPPPEPAPERGR